MARSVPGQHLYLNNLWIEMEDTPWQERDSWSPVGDIYLKMKERDQLLPYLFGWASMGAY